jgi:hypothetical protein
MEPAVVWATTTVTMSSWNEEAIATNKVTLMFGQQ